MSKPTVAALKKLKVHFVGGCSFAWWSDGVRRVSEPVAAAHAVLRNNGYADYWDKVPKISDDLREVTCGYCKTKLLNELWFKNWAELTDQELALLAVLRERRAVRKAAGK